MPAVVENSGIRDTLMREPAVEHALELAKRVDIMVQGIGALCGTESSFERAGYLQAKGRKDAKAKGAVAHMAARMIDADGNELEVFAKRVISIPLEYMRKVKWSIGIIASPAKVPALLAAIRGGYFNTIVVDEESAKEMLRLKEVVAA